MRFLTTLLILLLSFSSLVFSQETCVIVTDVNLGECEGAKIQFVSSENFQVFESPDGMTWTNQVDEATINYDVVGDVIAFESENGLITYDGTDISIVSGSDAPYYIIYYKVCKTCVYNGFNKTLCSEFGCTVIKGGGEYNPCEGVMCEPPLVCVDGECIDLCADVKCDEGYACEDGECVITDPCADVSCEENEICDGGECIGKTPSLTIEKQANTESTTADGTPAYKDGIEYSYTITVINDGDVDQTDVMVFDQLPMGLTIVGDDSGGAYIAPDWTIGDLAVGEMATLTIDVMPNTDGEIDLLNLASVSSSELPEIIEVESLLPEVPCTECWKFPHHDNATFHDGSAYIPVPLPNFTGSHTGQGSVMMGVDSGQGIVSNQYFWNLGGQNAIGFKRGQEYSISIIRTNCAEDCETDIRFLGEKKAWSFLLAQALTDNLNGTYAFGVNGTVGTGANLLGGFGGYVHGTPVNCESCELESYRVNPVNKQGEILKDIWVEVVVGYTTYQLCEEAPEPVTSIINCEGGECSCEFQLVDHNNGNEPVTELSLSCKGEYHVLVDDCTSVTSISLVQGETVIEGVVTENGNGILQLDGVEAGSYLFSLGIDGCDDVRLKAVVDCEKCRNVCVWCAADNTPRFAKQNGEILNLTKDLNGNYYESGDCSGNSKNLNETIIDGETFVSTWMEVDCNQRVFTVDNVISLSQTTNWILRDCNGVNVSSSFSGNIKDFFDFLGLNYSVGSPVNQNSTVSYIIDNFDSVFSSFCFDSNDLSPFYQGTPPNELDRTFPKCNCNSK